MAKNPIQSGAYVIYDPTTKGRGSIINTDLRRLQPGQKYEVAEVIDEDWLVMKGFENCVPSALYWTEFKIVPHTPSAF